MPKPKPAEPLTVQQAAAALGLTEESIYYHLRAGRLFPGARRFGRAWALPAGEVEAARSRSGRGRPPTDCGRPHPQPYCPCSACQSVV